LVVDPFAGGGSIPLEALRVGCDTFASDLNPVACHILKVMLEDIPRLGPKLAEELRQTGIQLKSEVGAQLSEFFPKEADGSTPIAYLWARTVRCEAPNCGAEIPLVRSFWLCKKAKRRRALRYRIEHVKGRTGKINFDVFEPNSESDVQTGTVSRAKATCLCCNVVLAADRVRAQLAAQRGGADVVFDESGQRVGGALLLAVVTVRPGDPGRHYRTSLPRDYVTIKKAQLKAVAIIDDWKRGSTLGECPVPDEPISLTEIRRISVPLYGIKSWGELFTARQKVALSEIAGRVRELSEGGHEALRACLAIILDRSADYNSTSCRWVAKGEFIGNTFGRQAIPLVWDFAEVNVSGDATGGLSNALDWVASVIENIPPVSSGQALPADARNSPLADESADVWFTDPPYYDSVPYAHLSDFFVVWLRRAIGRQAFSRISIDPTSSLAPKAQEIVVDRRHRLSTSTKDSRFYEEGMALAFAEGRRVLRADGIGAVVFAHKTTEGWEALLSGIIRGGWTIAGSWPVTTEMGARLNARDTASLATSVHIILRPRADSAETGDWAEVLRELPGRVSTWMKRLQLEGVRGADLVFACIGPALEIFSRFARVETAEGQEVTLAQYLEKVWEVVGRSALEQVLGTSEAQARNGAAGALEEDARLTALFLWTLQATGEDAAEDSGDEIEDEEEEEADEADGDDESSRRKPKGFTLIFDVVRRFAQPLGINLPKWEGRVIDIKKGVVRLLPIAERAKQLFGDEGAQAIATRLEREGVSGATPLQGLLFPELEATPAVRGRAQRSRGGRIGGEGFDPELTASREATTLDRVHAAMLLQAAGRTNALRALLKAEQERGSDFLRLANALSALYPKGNEEKRLLDAMLLAVPR
jgi:adenine-specific DNA methylase